MSSDPPSPLAGFAVEVFGGTNIGRRASLEDVVGMDLQAKASGQVFAAVFDGHGGAEAAQFANEELWSNIQSKMPGGFSYSLDSEAVKKAICHGFRSTHDKMRIVRPYWKRRKNNTLSTSGTTASVVIIQRDRMFVANVGDSTVVLGYDPNFSEDCHNAATGDRATMSHLKEEKAQIKAAVLTDDHKPESDKETKRIERIGGRVLKSAKGDIRVAWLRKKPSLLACSRVYEAIPFLNVARSLGDFWSYSEKYKDYFVSPVPDVTEYRLDIRRDKFVVVASDGLWNAMTPQEVTEVVHMFCQEEMIENPLMQSSKVAQLLIEEALERWSRKNPTEEIKTADNISVVVIFFMAHKNTSGLNEQDSASSLGHECVPSIDSGSSSCSGSPSRKECEDTDLPHLDISTITAECLERSAPHVPSSYHQELADEVEVIINAADDRNRSKQVANPDSNGPLDTVAVQHLTPHPDSVISSPRSGACGSTSNEVVATLGKRKSVAMSEGHFSPVPVPCRSKRRSVEQVDEYILST